MYARAARPYRCYPSAYKVTMAVSTRDAAVDKSNQPPCVRDGKGPPIRAGCELLGAQSGPRASTGPLDSPTRAGNDAISSVVRAYFVAGRRLTTRSAHAGPGYTQNMNRSIL